MGRQIITASTTKAGVQGIIRRRSRFWAPAFPGETASYARYSSLLRMAWDSMSIRVTATTMTMAMAETWP